MDGHRGRRGHRCLRAGKRGTSVHLSRCYVGRLGTRRNGGGLGHPLVNDRRRGRVGSAGHVTVL